MNESDWDREAVAMAEHVAANFSEVPRGALAGRQARVSVVFGNDRSPAAGTREDEVARIRAALDDAGIRILGVGLDPESGSTWAMIVESEDVPMLNDLVAGS
jgi:hypothetical protein